MSAVGSSQTLSSFWRTVRHKGIWLKPKHLMRWHTSEKLHAHTSDACVQAFFASLKSWRTRRKTDPDAHPPRERRFYFRIEYKSTAMRHTDGQLTLSNGKGHVPLVLDWPRESQDSCHPLDRHTRGADSYSQRASPTL